MNKKQLETQKRASEREAARRTENEVICLSAVWMSGSAQARDPLLPPSQQAPPAFVICQSHDGDQLVFSPQLGLVPTLICSARLRLTQTDDRLRQLRVSGEPWLAIKGAEPDLSSSRRHFHRLRARQVKWADLRNHDDRLGFCDQIKGVRMRVIRGNDRAERAFQTDIRTAYNVKTTITNFNRGSTACNRPLC
jgi:hypothetical protein